ncbi:MAG TPA: M20/M25/M40 family metallo-hydrolase, partial [Acidobacteriota bacterium]|nr:M20/M25/M40 family metallo-hydrolase [Acidobacteriota bacterium]
MEVRKRSYVILVVAVLLAILVVRTLRFTSQQVAVTPVTLDSVDSAAAAARLAGALRFKTVSTQDPSAFRPEEFLAFRSYLEQQYPHVHDVLACEVVDGYSLLYTWKGQDASLKPVLLMAHMDVVPAESESAWEHPPFAGSIAGGFVWGRGALDDKGSAMALFESVEALLKEGFRPKRTVYLAFGHNEEVLGSGAEATAQLLKSRGVQLQSVLDEGSAVVVGMVPGVSAPVALVGTAEKGYMSVRLTVEMEGGHSSMPPRHTDVGVLSNAIVELEKRRMPARLGPPVDRMFEYLGPELSLPGRVIFANLWLLGPLVRQILAGSPPSNAMIRTTTAPTMFE